MYEVIVRFNENHVVYLSAPFLDIDKANKKVTMRPDGAYAIVFDYDDYSCKKKIPLLRSKEVHSFQLKKGTQVNIQMNVDIVYQGILTQIAAGALKHNGKILQV